VLEVLGVTLPRAAALWQMRVGSLPRLKVTPRIQKGPLQ
jgi:hypothetical protein